MTATFQRETYDWLKVTVHHAGVVYEGAWEYQIVPHGDRPTGTWVAAVQNGGDLGVVIQGLAPGYHWLFYRIDGVSPYLPVPDPITLLIQ